MFHPAGKIGRKLLLRVSDLMATGENIPRVHQSATLREAIVSISRGKMGAGVVVDASSTLLGIVTDGDLRRLLEKQQNPLDLSVASLMTLTPRSLAPDQLAVEALNQMNEHAITVMPVVSGENTVVGMLHLHELLAAGLS